ncbi:ACR, YggU family COG1872 domain-containing protein [Babesia caballi]|uniref:ACR, YggU family COG1872 domain-containing protein n=1 Tax=Babesia caballi TaxID=5871 RepID=A0AAV4LZ45_BABCB|nr:ACR, YggU family COG1872 domain-containing protein [Babesia caballi]
MLVPRFTSWIAWNALAVSGLLRHGSVMSSRKSAAPNPQSDQDNSPLVNNPNGTLLLKVRVKPGAKFTQLVGEFVDPLGVQVAAPPREGACNEALVEFVCDVLKLKKRDVTLTSGHKSRDKVLSISGIAAQAAEERLRKQLEIDA